MRKRGLVLAMLVLVWAAPVFAGSPPQMEDTPPPDDLTKVPMECLMPSLPFSGYDATAPDTVNGGVSGFKDFLENTGVYFNCIGNKLIMNMDLVYERIVYTVQKKINGAPPEKAPAN